MARIVRFHKIGGPEVLKIEEMDVPPPGKGEVRIQVKAFGINRAEVMYRSGSYLVEPNLPSKIGYEASGIIESVGPEVKEFVPGDVVSVVPVPDMNRYGVYGELAIVPAWCVVKHPSFLSFTEATSLWMQYLTAYGALINIAHMSKGDFVVIPAASSSVGIAAIELANLKGAIPIAATRSSAKKDALLKAGAKYVIATEEENLANQLLEITKGQGARIIFDPVGGKTVASLAEGASQNGIIIIYGALSPDPTPFPLNQALAKSLTMRGYVLFELIAQKEQFKEAVAFISKALEEKKLKPIIAKTFKLDQIVEAHRYMESNEQLGKIVVTC